MNRKEFFYGMKSGIPVCIGYFSVSFGFGAMAIAHGLNVFDAILISTTNLTSAGQFAGLTVIASGATIIQMIMTQLVLNSRYFLMSLALGQRLGQKTGIVPRLLTACFVTDEVFALGMARGSSLTVSYFAGAGITSAAGWILGTAAGATAGSLLPESAGAVLGVMLYGMFVAIVIPQAKQEKSIFACMVIAMVFSSMFAWMPQLKRISGGLAIVICTVLAAALAAVLSPVDEEEKS